MQMIGSNSAQGQILWGLLLVAMLWLPSQLQAAVVLQYHHVSDTTPRATSVTPERFREHMDYLAEWDFEVVPLESLVGLLREGKPLPDKTVAITFDDAYESVYDTAFPLLKRRGWPFTVFVNTAPLDAKKGGFVTWGQLREMARVGASIANHSTEHNHLQRLKPGESRAQWRERIRAEVMDAEKRIREETGQSHRILAYPYGEYDHRVTALLEELDFAAFGQQSGALGSLGDLQTLPRFPFGGPYGDLEDFATKVNTKPLPLESAQLYADWADEQPLTDLVVAEGDRPVLKLNLAREGLVSRTNCFASGQGAIETRVEGQSLLVRADEPLSPGRTRYNCTAASSEPGRFHWFSQQWLVTGPNGQWLHEQ